MISFSEITTTPNDKGHEEVDDDRRRSRIKSRFHNALVKAKEKLRRESSSDSSSLNSEDMSVESRKGKSRRNSFGDDSNASSYCGYVHFWPYSYTLILRLKFPYVPHKSAAI